MTQYFTPEEEDQLNSELDQLEERLYSKQRQSSPLLAQNLIDWRTRYPKTTMGLLLPVVQAYSENRLDEEQADKILNNMTGWMTRTKSQKEEKTLWGKIYSGLKTGVRWTLAASSYSNELFTNLIRAQYNARSRQGGGSSTLLGPIDPTFSPEGTSIATDFGTLLENPDQAGDGFFISRELNKKKVERQARLAPLIGGKVPTLGRIYASYIVDPNSRPYNILSGFVDFTQTVTVPALPGSQTAKAVGQVGLAKAGVQTLAGLTDLRTGLIRPDRVAGFIDSKAGRSAVQRMVDIDSVDKALDAFPTADLDFLYAVAKTTDENQMRDLLKNSLGVTDESVGRAATSVQEINLTRWDTFKRNNLLQKDSLVPRFMTSLGAKMNGGEIVFAAKSSREKLASIKNTQNYLKTLKIDPQLRAKLIDDLTESFLNDDGTMAQSVQAIENVIRESFKKMGVSDDRIDDLVQNLKTFRTDIQKSLYGQGDDLGNSRDFGGRFPVPIDGQIVMLSQPLNVPMLQSEAVNHILMLPDQRVTRRIMSKYVGKVTGKSGLLSKNRQGELRWGLAKYEWAQNQVWKPLQLLTGGYATRNISEGLMFMSFAPNAPLTPLHPLQWIGVAMHKQMVGDITGLPFKPTTPGFLDQWRSYLDGDMPEFYAESILKSGQRQLAQAVDGSMREFGPVSHYAKQKKTGNWRWVDRQGFPKQDFLEGVAAETAILASDPIARMVAAGLQDDEILQILKNEQGLRNIKRIQNLWRDIPSDVGDGKFALASYKFLDADGNPIDQAILEYVRTIVRGSVEASTGGNYMLKEIIASGGLKDAEGNFRQLLKFESGAVDDLDVGNVDAYSDELWDILSQAYDDPNVRLKNSYKQQQMIDSETKERWNRGVDIFFGHLYPKRETFLLRSPVWRAYYYKAVDELIDNLAPGEINNIVASIIKYADENNVKATPAFIKDFVGNNQLGERLLKTRAKEIPDTAGTMTVKQLDEYAKDYALNETKRNLYDASERSNFADIFRIIAPFGPAWAEVSKRWGKLLSTDPDSLKKISIGTQSLEGFDPDGDGKGMFYTDPNTGERMFVFPFGNEFAPFILGWAGAVTGGLAFGAAGALGVGAAGYAAGKGLEATMPDQEMQWAAPARSLNMAFNAMFPFGPGVQVAAWQILKDKPEFDNFRQFIAPYGQPDFVPSWAQKAWQAITQNPDSDKQYADLKLEMIRALVASGEYDDSTEMGKLEIEKDAADYASKLLMLQAIGQFVGPMRPSPDAIIDTKKGDVLASELSKAWYDMVREDYETAPLRFLDTFGDDVFLYMQSKSKAQVGGLEATKEFAEFEAKNGDLFKAFPEVAGYFVTAGTEYDMQVFIRQREKGMAKPLNAQEFLDLGQAKVGIALYRAAVRKAGPKPNDEQKAILETYRNSLEDRFPGFKNYRFDTKKTETLITFLSEAINTPSLDDNDVAAALRTYFEYREDALDVAESLGLQRTLTSNKLSDQRNFLRRVGEDLSARVPSFERVWNSVLFNEVDVY